jgi:hypothetical protein
VPLDQRGDIYVDAADSTATGVWLDPVKTQVWVLAQLSGQGILMRAAGRPPLTSVRSAS